MHFGENVYVTVDMSTAAWLKARGVTILSIQRRPERHREFYFIFDDTEGNCNDIALSFLNSPAHEFDNSLRTLKKICFGPGSESLKIASIKRTRTNKTE